MLVRRLAPCAIPGAAAIIPKQSIRAFSTTPFNSKAPALADVRPDSAAEFDARQKEFRQELGQRKLQREQDESQSASAVKSTSHSTPASDSDTDTVIAGVSSVSHVGQGLGSYSTSTTGRQQQESDGKKRGTGRLSSLIYGTEEGREMDREIERSFSQVLARGKYVHSIVFHEVKPSKVEEYVELVGSWYPKVASMPENKVC